MPCHRVWELSSPSKMSFLGTVVSTRHFNHSKNQATKEMAFSCPDSQLLSDSLADVPASFVSLGEAACLLFVVVYAKTTDTRF